MKNRVNKQIIKALSVGLAASMALQPVTAFAEEGDPQTTPITENDSVPAEKLTDATPVDNTSVNTPVDIEGGVADEAQEAAVVVSNDVKMPVVEEVSENVETPAATEGQEDVSNKRGDLDVTSDDIKNVTHDIAVSVDAERVEAGTNEANKNLAGIVREEAKELSNDTSISDAKSEIESAKKDLIIAEVADNTENKAAQAASENVNDIQTISENVDTTLSDAVKKADELVKKIQNANSIEAANGSYSELEQLSKDTKEAIDGYDKDLAKLNKQYDLAKDAFEKAQNRFDAAINGEDGAKSDVKSASEDVNTAKKNVLELQKAIKDANDNIAVMRADAIAIINAQEAVKNAKTDEEKQQKQDDLFGTVIEHYYAEDLVAYIGAKDISVNKHENGYFSIDYTVDGEKVSQYYSYEFNKDGEMVFWLKSAEEVQAIDYLAEFEKTHSDVEMTDADKVVYSYTVNGTTVYKTAYELKNQAGVAYDEDNDEYYIVNGAERIVATYVTEQAAPSKLEDVAENGKMKSVEISSTTRSEYVVENGKLIKYTYADVTEQEWQRIKEIKGELRKTAYSDSEMKAIKEQLGDNVKFAKAENVTDGNTYYCLTGTYLPLFKFTISDEYLEEYTNGSEKAKNALLNEIKAKLPAGFTVTGSNLGTTWIKDWWKAGKEEYYVWGDVFYKSNTAVTVNNTQEYTSYDAAKEALENSINLATDGKSGTGDLTIKTVKTVYTWHIIDYKKTTIKTNDKYESYTDFEVTDGADGYSKYQVSVEYLKGLAASSEEKKISKAEYSQALIALNVIEDEYKYMNFNIDEDEDLKYLLNNTKNLLEKYARYSEEVDKVVADIDKTEKDLGTLATKIDDLDKAHENKLAVVALKDVLNKDQKLADYFGITDLISDEQAEKLEKMTVTELMEFLDELKDITEKKIAKSKEQLQDLQDKLDEAGDELTKTIDRLTPPSSGDDDDTTTGGGGDDTTTGGGDDTTTFIPVAVTPATNVVAPAADNAQAPAVLGARTTRRSSAKAAADTDTVATDNSNGNNDNAAVAGAQKEETKTPEAPKTETTIEETETALAATPELEEKGFAWWLLLILAAIAGVSVEEYARRKSNKAKAEAKDSTKINK